MVDIEEITDYLYQETGGVVQSGPFKGMKLLREQAWESGNLSPAILGCHEEELHDMLEQEITRLSKLKAPRIVNVGCAEGYYAIGMALRLPNAQVAVVDISEEALALAKKAAALNNVALLVGVTLDELFKAPDLVIMDCEGAEIDYINLEKWPGLKQATLLVEIHCRKDQLTDKILFERCHGIFDIKYIKEGPRNPNEFELLSDKNSDFRWAAVNEHRPTVMYWFVMQPARLEVLGTEVAGRQCGSCNLCCKLEHVITLNKSSNQWCEHCEVGVGCKIYPDRPSECKNFRCHWLNSELPDEFRPELIHLYAAVQVRSGYVKICVDPAHPRAWQTGHGADLVSSFLDNGLHAIIQTGRQINFVPGKNVPVPNKIILDWVL